MALHCGERMLIFVVMLVFFFALNHMSVLLVRTSN